MHFNSDRKNSHLGSPAILGLIVALVLLPTQAQAYIDPGTGSFVIQGLIAGVLGAGFAMKLFWHRIKARFTGNPVSDDEKADE